MLEVHCAYFCHIHTILESETAISDVTTTDICHLASCLTSLWCYIVYHFICFHCLFSK